MDNRLQPLRRSLFVPTDMAVPPHLGPAKFDRPVQNRYALLVNPFYPKDPRASFGKHVLTPTLALTSIAGATPPNWDIRYWDENLLQGPPPNDPVPAVVGITVHLTFARRAYILAEWYRAQGSWVILGGLHVLSCPDEAQSHADGTGNSASRGSCQQFQNPLNSAPVQRTLWIALDEWATEHKMPPPSNIGES
jgi:hypothetical protein